MALTQIITIAGQRPSAQALPTIVALVIGALVVAGLFGLTILIGSLRRPNEVPIVNNKISTVRFWRPTNFNLALGFLEELIKRWQSKEFDNRRGYVSEYDIIRWIIQLALTCAANIAPQSLGKASLFRIGEITFSNDGRPLNVRVYSFELDGIFSPEQMIDKDDPKRMRDFSISREHQDESSYPAALACIYRKEAMVQSLRERASQFDWPERKLGLTHILAIPLRQGLSTAVRDQPVSITVDLRYARPVGYLVDKFNLHHRTLIRRADRLAKALSVVTALHIVKFLPPPAPNRGSSV